MATEQEGHTTGPWVAEDADVFGDHNIILRDGEDRRAVAAVVSNMRDPSEVAANARLIAAAPGLLEAARRALNFIQNTEDEFGDNLPSGDALRAAIARATGEA